MNESRDRIIRNAVIWSDGHRLTGVDAVAISRGRVAAIGAGAALAPGAGAHVVDAGGATLTPGLADAHIHLLTWARALDELPLADAAGPDDVARRLAGYAAARPGGEALVGRGWDANPWSAPPDRAVLDRVIPDRPVLLHSHDFHALWVNGAALARAGVDRDRPDPPGGRIERDARGEPTGILRENAVRLVSSLEPAASEAVDRERLRRAIGRLHALGITAVHVFEGSRARRLLRGLAGSEETRLRVLMHLPHRSLDAALALGVRSGAGDDAFRIGAIKLFADGTLGSRTASMLEPYDGTDDRGMDLLSADELRQLVGRATTGGLAVAIHAIGDRALRSALDAFAAAGAAVRSPAVPCRIEHVQIARSEDLDRFAALGVAASLQPTHAVSDLEVAERWWGSRIERVYPGATLLARGARVAFGSDAPVEPPGAALTLHAAVTRQRPDGHPAGGWLPNQRFGLDAALSASTEGPARLAGGWPAFGRIAVGAHADLVLWDRDLHAADPGELWRARPRMTLVGGRAVHVEDALGPAKRSEVAA